MKEIIELIIAFIVIMSVLVGFILVTSTTSTTHLYHLPSSIVQAFAYDTEDFLSDHDLYDLNNPETIFNGLDELYPELHYRIRISSLDIQNTDNVIYLDNSNGQYVNFSGHQVAVRVPEPANVEVITIHSTSGSIRDVVIDSAYVTDYYVFTNIRNGRSVAIAIMHTDDATYIAYDFKRDQFIESYFRFQDDGLVIMIGKSAPDGSDVALAPKAINSVFEAYMVILYDNGTIAKKTIYMEFENENNYYNFDVYWDSSTTNRITNVDGRVLAIVPKKPNKIVKPGSYDILAIPYPSNMVQQEFETVYGAVPPEDIPISTYQYITYIDGVPVLVTVEVWRASV